MIRTAGDSKSITTAGAGAAEILMDMVPRRQYRLTARGANLWFRLVVAGEATAIAAIAGDGSHYLANGTSVDVAAIGSGNAGSTLKNRISIIRDGATDATGVLSEVPTVQAS